MKKIKPTKHVSKTEKLVYPTRTAPEKLAKKRNYKIPSPFKDEGNHPFPSVMIGDHAMLFNANNIDIIRRMPANSVDLIFTDPPYHLTSNKK